AIGSGNDGFHETGVIVLVVSRESVADFVEWKFRQQRNAVEGLLSVHGDVVAKRLEGLARKCVIDAFGFLQANDVRLALCEPSHCRIEPLLDRVDIPGGDAHGSLRFTARSWCRSRRRLWPSDC